jgi:cellulose 1,4-beta-cellobiosidase
MVNAYLLAAAMLAPLAAAQAGAWQQCGGIGHTGATTCISGYSCSVINDYYHQCLPGAATSSSSSSTTRTTTPTTTATATATVPGGTTTPAPTTTPTGAPVAGNIFAGKTQWANPYYASEVSNLAIPTFVAQGKTALASAAAKVAKVPSFTWLDTRAKIPSVREYLQKIRDDGLASTHVAPFVIYDLPDRDCSAAASNGELHLDQDGANLYKTDYIDKIVAILKDFPEIPVALVIEPDSLANMVTNMSVPKCQGAASAYHELTVYAVKQLSLPNVSMYLDGGHGGWLGWPANLPEAGKVLGKVYTDAGKPANLRGLATNVSNYNAWSIATW